jgi:DNA-binding response OmpR family regulator
MTIRILLADDSVTMQKIVGLAFGDEDVEIAAVSSGEAALESVRTFRPDIVLADVFMPGCSGYEVCAHIKENSEHTPVILLVGTFEPFDEIEASRVKSDGYITKPFDTSELIHMVHSLVEDKMMTQNSEVTSAVSSIIAQAPDPSIQDLSYTSPKGLVNSRILESFLGSDQILELFDNETLVAAAKAKLIAQTRSKADKAAIADSSPAPASVPAEQLTEDSLNMIVDKVIRRMSTDVVREVAWEVVPELSEILIRRVIEERNKL